MCSHFGWTLDYLEHGVPWATVQRMLIDAPGIEEKDKKAPVELALTDDNAGEVMELLNSFNK